MRKARTAALAEGNAGRAAAWRYVLTDPELDTFSYDVANCAELADGLSSVTGLPAPRIKAFFDELRDDTELRALVRRASRGNFVVQRDPPVGRHLAAYALVRARNPALVLEVGVRHGLGSLVLLRALQRNQAEASGPADVGDRGRGPGAPPSGRSSGLPAVLTSVDFDPAAGMLARRAMRLPAPAMPGAPRRNRRRYPLPRWRLTIGASPQCLPAAIAAANADASIDTAARAQGGVGVALLDSTPERRVTIGELAAVLRRAADPLIVLQSGWNTVLPDLCATIEHPCVRITDEPVEHVGAGRTAFVARFDADAAARHRGAPGPP